MSEDLTSGNSVINASLLGGATFAAPGPIGSGTPGTGAFTTLGASTLAIGNPTLGLGDVLGVYGGNASITNNQNGNSILAITNTTAGTAATAAIFAINDTGALVQIAMTSSLWTAWGGSISSGDAIVHTTAAALDIATNNANGAIKFIPGSSFAEAARVSKNGHLLIGTTTDGTQLLQVNGSALLGVTTITGSFTATGLVTNADLANSTISGIALGSNLDTLTFGAHLAAGGSSYNGSAGVTITSDATNSNTASTIVARDSSGNFSAGTITASLTGHASLDLALTGGTMSGTLAMGANTITGTGAYTAGSLAIGGATLGSNALAVTGNLVASGVLGVGTITVGGQLVNFEDDYNGNTICGITNTHTGTLATASFSAFNNATNVSELGIASSGFTPIGSLAAGDGYLLTSAASFDIVVNNSGGAIKFLPTNSFAEAMRVNSSGHLLIGTTTDSGGGELLQVNGLISANNFWSTGGTSGFTFLERTGGTNFSEWYRTGNVSALYDSVLAGNALSVSNTGALTAGSTIATKVYTVSTLPAAGTAGRRAYITDAVSLTFLGALTGGGSVKGPVFDNGTNWVGG